MRCVNLTIDAVEFNNFAKVHAIFLPSGTPRRLPGSGPVSDRRRWIAFQTAVPGLPRRESSSPGRRPFAFVLHASASIRTQHTAYIPPAALQSKFRSKPFQGRDPQLARAVVLGIDANYSPPAPPTGSCGLHTFASPVRVEIVDLLAFHRIGTRHADCNYSDWASYSDIETPFRPVCGRTRSSGRTLKWSIS